MRRYSTSSTTGKSSEQKLKYKDSKEKRTEEENAQEEVRFEEEAAPPKNVYWMWTKRAVLVMLLYTGISSGYSLAENFMIYRSGFLEIEPFYSVGKKISGWGQSAYHFMFNPPLQYFLPPKVPIKSEIHKKTLVINFEGTLYAKDFKARDGLVIHLRPGFYKFLQQISNEYEILLYSEEDTSFMQDVIMTIDPSMRFFNWSFGHEFMVWTSQGYRKDLRLVNRDLRKIVVVDLKKEIYANNPDNILVLKKYEGEEEDSSLRDLGLFLAHLANPSIRDVRKEIIKYGDENAVKNYADQLMSKVNDQANRRGFFKRPRIIAQ